MDQKRDGGVREPTAVGRDDALRDYLEAALERSEDAEARYHLRQALQMLTA